MTTRTRLLNPGPVTLTPRVRAALTRTDLCHREPEYAALALDVRARLERVYEETASGDYAAVLLTGSGTAAVEAMVGSFVPRHGRALVVQNGVYGDRIAQMLAVQGKVFEVVASDWLRDIDIAAASRRLLAEPAITHVLSVHHETTTGRLNSIAALGELCVRHNKPLLLDAVSSFGGEPIRFADWNIQAVAATANKCLHGVPGISFVVAQKAALRSPLVTGATSVYLDLFRHWKEQQSGYSPFTPSVHVMYALQEALTELEETGGWRARHELYQHRATIVRTCLKELGVELFLEDGESASSAILTSFKIPDGASYDALHDGLKALGFVIYAGQGPYMGKMFRIAVMGDLQNTDIEELCAGLRSLLERDF